MDTYDLFLKTVFQYIPESYFSTHKSRELDSNILKNHQFITLIKNAPVVFGIFNLVKMGYEFLSPNMKNIMGYDSELVMGEDGMAKVLSTFRPEHAQIHNTKIFPVLFGYLEKHAVSHDISNFSIHNLF